MKKLCLGFMVVVLSVVSSAVAQHAGPGSSPAQAAMERIARVLEKQSFSAKVVMTMTTSDGKSAMPAPMEFAMVMSQGKSRMEMDMAKMAGAAGGRKGEETGGMPPGLGKMVTISRPDKKVVYQIMPGLTAYAEIAIPDATAGKGQAAKIDRQVEGTEKVESYTCEKVRNTVTQPDGKTQVVVTWEAKELKGMPVKLEAEMPEGKVTMVYKDIRTDKPADSLFEPPAGYTKYNSMQEMIMSGMMQKMGQPK